MSFRAIDGKNSLLLLLNFKGCFELEWTDEEGLLTTIFVNGAFYDASCRVFDSLYGRQYAAKFFCNNVVLQMGEITDDNLQVGAFYAFLNDVGFSAVDFR